MSNIFKRTKIMATIGPATWNPTDGQQAIESIMNAGVDIYRLNFSHGSFEEKEHVIRDIRAASERLGRRVAIVQDLQGPKIRLGDIKDDSLHVKTGDELVLDYALRDAEHDGSHTLPLQYNLAEKVKPGEIAWIFDGKVKTTIIEISSPTAIKVRVENDGEIKRKKGINLPDTDFGSDVFPEKDLEDMRFGADKDIDFVALSFIQSADNIVEGRRLLKEAGYPDSIKIIAKIETKQSVVSDAAMDAIAREADVVMVARGDMAYEVGMQAVPTIQRKLVHFCRRYGTQVIVATQTMGTMYNSPIPTRAEADNVASAVIMGADAIMLSEETAVGEFPLETIQALREIIEYTQENNPVEYLKPDVELPVERICRQGVKVAEGIEADAIVAETKTGFTTWLASANRPSIRIVSVSDDPRVANQLVMCYGVDSYVAPFEHNFGFMLAERLEAAGVIGHESEDTVVVILSGRQQGVVGGTDTIQVRTI
ncbi:pyruvate kinase [Candidatus Saccharibacteria bacterium]|nr:pyruvate kinase [Candidatus Saccharibacteria bacterium]